jgi:hypothetical protein
MENAESQEISNNLSPYDKFLKIFFNESTVEKFTELDTVFSSNETFNSFCSIFLSEEFDGKISLTKFTKFMKANNIIGMEDTFIEDFNNQMKHIDSNSVLFDILYKIRSTSETNKRRGNSFKSSFLDIINLHKNSKKIFDVKYLKDNSINNITVLYSKFICLLVFLEWKNKGFIKSSIVSNFEHHTYLKYRINKMFSKIMLSEFDKLRSYVDSTKTGRSIQLPYSKHFYLDYQQRIIIIDPSYLSKYKESYIKVKESIDNILGTSDSLYMSLSCLYFDILIIKYSNFYISHFIGNGYNNFISMINNPKIEIVLKSFNCIYGNPIERLYNVQHYRLEDHKSLLSMPNNIISTMNNIFNTLGFCSSDESNGICEIEYINIRNSKYYSISSNILKDSPIARSNFYDSLIKPFSNLKNIISLSNINFNTTIYVPFLIFFIDFYDIFSKSSLAHTKLQKVFTSRISNLDFSDKDSIIYILSKMELDNIEINNDSYNELKILNKLYHVFLSNLDESLVDEEDLECEYIFFKHYSDFLNNILISIKDEHELNSLPFDYEILDIENLNYAIEWISSGKEIPPDPSEAVAALGDEELNASGNPGEDIRF